MKLSDILLLTLFFVMGSMIFAIKQMQKAERPVETAAPTPSIKPVLPQAQAGIPELRLQLSTPKTPGSYGRLSLDKFLARTETKVTLRPAAPKSSAQRQSEPAPAIRPAEPFNPPTEPKLDLSLQPLPAETVEPINLPDLSIGDEAMFIDRVVQMAEASPVRPDARGCGTLNHGLGVKKEAKVRSVGMERQLTKRASIGVEYVYKDGCYKNAIAALPVQNMPGDDGVNLRVNMRF